MTITIMNPTISAVLPAHRALKISRSVLAKNLACALRRSEITDPRTAVDTVLRQWNVARLQDYQLTPLTSDDPLGAVLVASIAQLMSDTETSSRFITLARAIHTQLAELVDAPLYVTAWLRGCTRVRHGTRYTFTGQTCPRCGKNPVVFSVNGVTVACLNDAECGFETLI